MNSNQCLGMSSAATSSAAGALESPQGSDDGLHTSDISSVTAEDKLSPSDNLSHFGLGSC
jgi:hypothetical protein